MNRSIEGTSVVRKVGKKAIVVLAVTGVIAIGGAAFAFWTAGGTGTGTVAVGTNTPITVNQTSTVTGIAPGVAAQPLSGNFTNANTSTVHVATVTVTVTSTDKPLNTPNPGCTAADFTIVGGTMAVNADVVVGTNTGAWTGATIAFNNTAINQDACKGAVVKLAYVAA
jgi:hypothetical protein